MLIQRVNVRGLDNPRAPFNDAGGFSEGAGSLTVTCEVVTSACPSSLRGRVRDLGGKINVSEGRPRSRSYIIRVHGVRIIGGFSRISDAVVHVNTACDAEVSIVQRHVVD